MTLPETSRRTCAGLPGMSASVRSTMCVAAVIHCPARRALARARPTGHEVEDQTVPIDHEEPVTGQGLEDRADCSIGIEDEHRAHLAATRPGKSSDHRCQAQAGGGARVVAQDEDVTKQGLARKSGQPRGRAPVMRGP